MKIGNWFSLWDWSHVKIGVGYVDRLAIIEIKYLFSIYFNIWNTSEQDRYHNHAFNSVSIMLRGWYYEEDRTKLISRELMRTTAWFLLELIQAPSIRWIGRNYMHRIHCSACDALSLTFAGPWAKTWQEIKVGDPAVRTFTWGRKEVLH